MLNIKISKDSRFIRFFQWVWEADLDALNICKLFWGTLLFPLAFISFESVFRFVPRMAIFYAMDAAVFIYFGDLKAAVVWSLIALLFVGIGYIESRRKQNPEVRRAEKAERLNRLSSWGSEKAARAGEKMEPAFDRIADAIARAADSRAAGFIAVIAGYLRAIKQRTCPKVQIV